MSRLDTYGPNAALTWMERVPMWQGGAVKGLSLFALGNVPNGAVLLNRVGYVADTASIVDADPGAGNVRWDNPAQASATVIYIADADSAAADHSALWATVAVGGYLYMANQAMTVRQVWQVTAVTDAAGYVKLGVTLVASSGPFADNDPLDLSLQQPSNGGGAGIVPVPIIIACSDENTALTAGAAKCTFRMPYAFTLTGVRASVTTAPTGSVLTADINEGGVSILSTKLTIDATEKTSTTAAVPAVISDTALADDAEITIDIDTVGSTVAGAGLKVTLIGYKP